MVFVVDQDKTDIKLTGRFSSLIARKLKAQINFHIIPSLFIDLRTDTGYETYLLSQELQVNGTQQEVPQLGGITADISQMNGGPTFTKERFFQMGVNGTFFDSQQFPERTFDPSTFPLRDPNGTDAQFYLSDYTLHSIMQAGYHTGKPLDISYILEKVLNIPVITTNLIGRYIPQILTKYGSDVPVSITGKWIDVPGRAVFEPGLMFFNGSL